MHIANISIYVHDVDRAIAFYRDALRWEVTGDFPMGEHRWVTVAPRHEKTAIVLVRGFGGWQDDKVGGWTGIVIDVDDVERTYQELHERGVEFEEPPRRETWGGWAMFADSEGNLIGLHDGHRVQPERERGVMSKFLGA